MRLDVILCTHNPRGDFLGRTLDALKRQTLSRDEWSLLIVDNASAQPVVDCADFSWHENGSCIVEESLGLTNARIRGIRETSARWIVFIDDDNVLCPEYLERVRDYSETHSFLGSFGAGKINLLYEDEPSEEVRPWVTMLGLRSADFERWSNVPLDDASPWGAGLVLQRKVAETFCERVERCPLRAELGRKGDNLTAGEDIEFSYVACELGLGKGVFPALQLDHLIPAKRVQSDYLLRLRESITFSHAILDAIHGQTTGIPEEPPSIRSLRSALASLKPREILWELIRWNDRFQERGSFIEAIRIADVKGLERARRFLEKRER